MSDGELVDRVRRGEGAAAGELFSRYWRAARAAAFGATGEWASAEDAASEGFRQALVRIGSLEDPDRFAPWLRRIVIRKARDGARQRRLLAAESGEILPDPERPGEALERRQLAAVIHEAARRLPEPLRETMALHYFEGYEPPEAARFLGIPAGTLRRRLHDGRQRLRVAVEEILDRSKPMNDDQQQRTEKLRAMIAEGDIYQATREAFALRARPGAFTGLLPGGLDAVRQLAREVPPLEEGPVLAAIRKALPEFEEWQPGWDQTKVRPGAYIRVSRALVHRTADGRVRSAAELVRDCPDEQAFQAASGGLELTAAADLIWTAPAVDLRAVQALLERLAVRILPAAEARFSHYDEPRYRAALQLHFADAPFRAAAGGVLAGGDAAHVRIFSDRWAPA